jgi:hypothetical protein
MSEKFKRIPTSLPDPRKRKRKRKLRRRKDAESSYAAKPASAVFTRVILALLVGVSLLMFGVLGIRHWSQPDRVGEPAPRVEARKQTAPPVVWQGQQPGQIADKFLAATTPQERLRWVRQPGAVADLMERFYRDGPGATEKVADFQKMPQGATDDQIFERFTVTMTDGSKRLLCVPFDESGAGVDFKSYARHCSAPWSAVLAGTAPKADEMRVFLQQGSYYNYAFADEREWLCLLATSPELENPIHLYARKDNPDLLLFLQNPPQQPQRYTIALENTGQGHLNRQWQLTRVITTGWVAPSGF